MKKSTPRVLVFDLDDTLIPSSRIYEQAYEALGLLRAPADVHFAQAKQNVKAQLPPLHTAARNRLLYFKKYLELQNQFTTSQVFSLMDRYEKEIFSRTKEAFNAEREEFFKHLKSEYFICILTNENLRTQLIKLSAIDPRGELFDLVLTSEEVGFEKPAPEIFAALERAVLSSPKFLARHPTATVSAGTTGGTSADTSAATVAAATTNVGAGVGADATTDAATEAATDAPTDDAISYTMIGDSQEHDVVPALARGWRAILATEYVDKKNQNYKGNQVDRIEDLTYILSK